MLLYATLLTHPNDKRNIQGGHQFFAPDNKGSRFRWTDLSYHVFIVSIEFHVNVWCRGFC